MRENQTWRTLKNDNVLKNNRQSGISFIERTFEYNEEKNELVVTTDMGLTRLLSNISVAVMFMLCICMYDH